MATDRATLDRIHDLLGRRLLAMLERAEAEDLPIDPRIAVMAAKWLESQNVRAETPNPQADALKKLKESGKLARLPRFDPAADVPFK